MNVKNSISNPFVRLIITLIIIAGIAILLSSLFFVRIDLTSEKRYTLSAFTKETLSDLDDVVNVRIYLDGDLNIPFRKMQQNLRETLDEFRVYAGSNLQYEVINPFKGKNTAVVDSLINELYEKGLKPTNIVATDKEGGTSEKLIFPGSVITYKDIEVPVNFLKNNPGVSAEENINNSIQTFEFELMRVISSLSDTTLKKVAFIEGHGEFNEYEVGDITNELGWYFQVDRGRINGQPGILNDYKAVIIAGPSEEFNEKDKFIIDQYIMRGGSVLWFIDMVNASMDSISDGGSMIALIKMLNIEDMLFRYGARINPVLVQDIQCNMIPVDVALAGNSPDFRPVPWLYSPLLSSSNDHPVTRNLNMIKSEFTGYIDTIEARKNIKKTVLLNTSEFSRQIAAPAVISLDEASIPLRQENFNDPFLPVAVLLEGKFESAFKNRMINSLFPGTAIHAVNSGQPANMLVVADADIIRNDVRPTPQGILISPLGYDRYTRQTYGNKEFIVNSIQYMTGQQGLIELRSRAITLRLLDKTKTIKSFKWIIINTLIPPLLIIMAGIIYSFIRRKKYTEVLETTET